jgi:hypothetical protein
MEGKTVMQKMKQAKFRESMTFRIDENRRVMIETLSENEQISIGEACRSLIDEGARVRGLIE